MKILMLTSGTIHSSLSHRLLSLARQLVKQGHEVTVLAPSRDKYSKFAPDNETNIDGIKLIYPAMLRTKSTSANLLPYLLSSLLHVLFSDAELVYIYKPTPITVTGIIARLLKRTPLVTDMDDLGSEVMRIEGNPGIMTRLVQICEYLSTQLATHLVVASVLLENEYRDKYPLKPILRLPNGVDATRLEIKARTGTPHIVFFGALNRARIVTPLLESLTAVISAAGSRNVIVDIIGDGSAKEDLVRLATKLGVMKNVSFHGWRSLEQMKRIARAGDIGICVMPQERTTAACSNQKIFQYQAMGMAIIATKVGDLPIYLNKGKAGIILKSNDPAELSKAVVDLLHDRNLRITKAGNGKHLAETVYSWRSLGVELNDFIQSAENLRSRVREMVR